MRGLIGKARPWRSRTHLIIRESRFAKTKAIGRRLTALKLLSDNLQELFASLANQSVSEGWWRAGELNPRPLRCERSALPTELAPHTWDVGIATRGPRRVYRT